MVEKDGFVVEGFVYSHEVFVVEERMGTPGGTDCVTGPRRGSVDKTFSVRR